MDTHITLQGDPVLDAELIEQMLGEDPSFIKRELKRPNQESPEVILIYMDGMVNVLNIAVSVLHPLLERMEKGEVDIDLLENSVLANGEVRRKTELNDVIGGLLYGDCAVLAKGGCVMASTKGWDKRTTQEPSNEKVLRGPREGFVESVLINLSLLRRRLLTEKLRVEKAVFGELTQTKAFICYLEERVNPTILKELKKRLSKIKMDGVLDANYILEQIRDAPHTPFRTVGVTERPDVCAAKLMEGRVALIVDGTPSVLTLPFLFIENFQTNEDYYVSYIYGTLSRCLRMIGFFLTLSVPGIYIAVVTHHQEILPPQLMLSIAASRQGVPFPSVVEVLVLLVIFDILREASSRMPDKIGQTLSIVGALVLGQAAVEAKIVSAPVVIVVALTGTVTLLIPPAVTAEVTARFFLLVMSAWMGMPGYSIGVVMILTRLACMKSFGIAYTSLGGTQQTSGTQDAFHRSRWGKMRQRELFTHLDEQVRKE